jgi:hypothetical protein
MGMRHDHAPEICNATYVAHAALIDPMKKQVLKSAPATPRCRGCTASTNNAAALIVPTMPQNPIATRIATNTAKRGLAICPAMPAIAPKPPHSTPMRRPKVSETQGAGTKARMAPKDCAEVGEKRGDEGGGVAVRYGAEVAGEKQKVEMADAWVEDPSSMRVI